MSIEDLQRGIDAHREHQAAMAQVSLDIARQREADAIASGALLIPPAAPLPVWDDPSPDERPDDVHNAT